MLRQTPNRRHRWLAPANSGLESSYESRPGYHPVEVHTQAGPTQVSLHNQAVEALVITVTAQPADAQTFQVIHNFSGQGDGSIPLTGLTIDTSGKLYGTTGAGAAGHGTVFLLNHAGSAWVVNTLYAFAGGNDGSSPGGRVSIARDGTLYGATEFGGGWDSNGCGTVYQIGRASC